MSEPVLLNSSQEDGNWSQSDASPPPFEFEVFDMRDTINVFAYSIMSAGMWGKIKHNLKKQMELFEHWL